MNASGHPGLSGRGSSLPPRARSVPFAVAAGAALTACLIVLGCSGPRRDTVRTYPPAQPPSDCACTLEHRMNLCLTVNGATALPDSSVFVREREDGSRDTLPPGARCFGEWRGLQRILREHEARLVDSTGWFEIGTVDCCHGEAKTVDFTVPP